MWCIVPQKSSSEASCSKEDSGYDVSCFLIFWMFTIFGMFGFGNWNMCSHYHTNETIMIFLSIPNNNITRPAVDIKMTLMSAGKTVQLRRDGLGEVRLHFSEWVSKVRACSQIESPKRKTRGFAAMVQWKMMENGYIWKVSTIGGRHFWLPWWEEVYTSNV